MNSVRTRNSIYADCMRFELYSGPCTCNQQISRLAGLTPTSLGRAFGHVLGLAMQCNFYFYFHLSIMKKLVTVYVLLRGPPGLSRH